MSIEIAKKIIKILSQPYIIDGVTLQISACIGVTYTHGKKSIDDLLQEADLALYEAKRSGKGKYIISKR